MRGMSRTPPSSGAELRQARGLRDQFADKRVAPADLGQVEAWGPRASARGAARPRPSRSGPSRTGAIPGGRRARTRRSPGCAASPDRGGACRAPVLLQAAQVLGLRAEVVGGVADQGAGRAPARVVALEPESLEVEDAERLGHRLGARRVSKR
jgi:hypothetical protein